MWGNKQRTIEALEEMVRKLTGKVNYADKQLDEKEKDYDKLKEEYTDYVEKDFLRAIDSIKPFMENITNLEKEHLGYVTITEKSYKSLEDIQPGGFLPVRNSDSNPGDGLVDVMVYTYSEISFHEQHTGKRGKFYREICELIRQSENYVEEFGYFKGMGDEHNKLYESLKRFHELKEDLIPCGDLFNGKLFESVTFAIYGIPRDYRSLVAKTQKNEE